MVLVCVTPRPSTEDRVFSIAFVIDLVIRLFASGSAALLLVIGFEQLPGGQTAVRKPGGQVENYGAYFRPWSAQR